MKTLIPILFIAGLLLGPGYFFYCQFFSGSSVGKYTVFTQDVKTLNLGVVQSTKTSKAKWKTPVKFDLSPDMNPILINASFSCRQYTSISKRQKYKASLSKDDDAIWTRDFSISPKRSRNSKKSRITGSKITQLVEIMKFNVDKAGTYTFNMKLEGRNHIAISAIKIDIRKNVWQARPVLYVPGVIVLVLSLLLTVYYNIKKKKARNKPSGHPMPPGQF